MKLASLLSALVCTTTLAFAADNWPQFRGPTGDGQSAAKGLPVTWGETENVKWKTPIHDKGWSSPVIWGDQIWLTTATSNGTALFVLTLDKNTGKVTGDVKLFDAQQPELWMKYNSYASPTPVIEEGRVYVSFGEAGTACLDTKTGAKLWERRDLKCNHYRGAGSSPILHGNLLVLQFDGADDQFIVALDKRTGKDAWRVKRSTDYRDLGPDGKPKAEGDLRKGYATPQIATIEGKPVLLSNGAKAHYGYDPLTGKELWQVENQPFHSTGARPIFAHGLIYFSAGFSKGHFYAIKPPPASAWKAGNILDASKDSDPDPTKPQLAWKLIKGVPETPSPIVQGDLVMLVDNGGFASAVEAKTGKVLWSERVLKAVYASPISAEGNVYAFDREGKGVVFAAGREFKLLGESKLDGSIEAAPIAAGKALYVRTSKALFRIEK
ncbi:MAG: PQQ-binding-like beta-propeller repeat protein [Verrucomicrobia bacterium]|nr:PQQ-binding-like beta-propeller repeat protein [Verrucomicrobiota bacterium]